MATTIVFVTVGDPNARSRDFGVGGLVEKGEVLDVVVVDENESESARSE